MFTKPNVPPDLGLFLVPARWVTFASHSLPPTTPFQTSGPCYRKSAATSELHTHPVVYTAFGNQRVGLQRILARFPQMVKFQHTHHPRGTHPWCLTTALDGPERDVPTAFNQRVKPCPLQTKNTPVRSAACEFLANAGTEWWALLGMHRVSREWFVG